MDHIYDNVGLDAQGAVKLVVPHSVNIGAFPSAATQKGGWRLDAFTGDMLWSDGMVWKAAASITPAGLTKFDDANMTLSLGGSPSNALLQGVSITLAWAGLLAVAKGGSGAGTFTAGYLKANGTSPFTTVATIPYSDISGIAGKYVANNDADAGYAATIGTDPNTLAKSQYSYISGHANMFLGSGGYLMSIGGSSPYSAQLAIDSTGGSIGFRGQFASVWTAWKELATQNWVATNFTQYWGVSGNLLYPQTNSDHEITTYPFLSLGRIALVTGGSSFAGHLDTYSPSNVRQGYIGYHTGELAYTAEVGNHHFRGGGVQVDSVTVNNSITQLVVLGASNLLQYRDVSSLPFTNNTGTVTNVAMALPVNTFSISGSPVNTTGTLTGSFISQTAKYVLAAPWGSSGTPIWRQLQTSDLAPNSAVAGQVIMFDGTAWEKATLTYPIGNYVANADANAGYSTNIGATNPNTITKSQFSFSGGHANMFGGVGGHLMTIGQGSSYGAQLAVDTTGVAIGYRANYVGTWGAWKELADKTWVSTNFTQYWQQNVSKLTIQLPLGYNGYGISTHAGISYGYAELRGGELTNTGSINFYSTSHVRQGFIGYYSGELGYNATVGMHHFYGGAISIDNIPTGSTSINILTSSSSGSGTVQSRTLSSLTGVPSSVWYLQGTTTPATTTGQDVVRTGSVRIGAAGATTHKFNVVGTSYFTSTVLINNSAYVQFYNAAGSTAMDAFGIDTSNNIYIGHLNNAAIASGNLYVKARTALYGYVANVEKMVLDGTDVKFNAYPNTRNDVYTVWPLNVIYTNASGKFLSARGDLFQNDGGSVKITVDETNHIADSSPRRVTFNTIDTTNNTYISYDVSVGTDVKMRFGSSDMRYFVIAQIGYTMTGTSNVKMELRKTATAWETLEDTFTTKGSLTIHTIMSGGVTDYPSIYLTVSGAAINLYNARITMIPIGLTPP